MDAFEPNPYEPPLAVGAATLPMLPRSRWHELDIQVGSVTRGWWRRWITLTGSVDAHIEYDPRGNGERVYINGEMAVATSGVGWHIVQPRIEFTLEAFGHLVPACIHVKASLLLFRTKRFRLEVAERTVYED